MSETKPPKILAKGPANKELATKLLNFLGLWDCTPNEERNAFVERGEIWDTNTGRELIVIVKAAKAERETP